MLSEFFLSPDTFNVKLAIQLLANYDDQELGEILSEVCKTSYKLAIPHCSHVSHHRYYFNGDVCYYDYTTVISYEGKLINLKDFGTFGVKITFVPKSGIPLGDNIFIRYVDNYKGISNYYRKFIES
jgi:hypothetical protein